MYNRAIIIGGGHSTEGFDFNLLRKEFTFGINYTYKLIKPTVLVFDNQKFFDFNELQLKSLDSVLISHHCNQNGVNYIPSCDRYWGLESLKRKEVYTGSLTGIYTVNLVSCMRFKEIYLLGYDMNMSKEQMLHNRQLKHPHNSIAPYRPQIGKFDVFKKIPNIYNVGLGSAITAFPKINYDEFIWRITTYEENVNQTEARQWVESLLK